MWKIQLKVTINFISSEVDNDEEHVIHSKRYDKLWSRTFHSLKNRYQNNLESVRGSYFFFDYVHLMYYKCHKINLNRRGSYIDSPDWMENKKATINHINKKDNKCFQYAVTVVLNDEEIQNDPQRIIKIKPFIKKYNWEGINYPS